MRNSILPWKPIVDMVVVVNCQKDLENFQTAMARADVKPPRIAVSRKRGRAQVVTRVADPDRLQRALKAFNLEVLSWDLTDARGHSHTAPVR